MDPRREPVLVHNRIEKNHRSTIILVALVPLVLLPYAAGIALWWAPMVAMEAIAYGPGAIAFLGLEMQPPWGELRLVLITAGIVVSGMTVATLAALLLYRHVILGRTGARLLSPDQEPDLQRLVESLCIGAGLPLPRLYLIESEVPNAFATGRDPAHATLTLTRGLLTLLPRRELEGVVAHELSHIANHDSRLNTAVAAVVATLRLPIAIVSGVYRFFRAMHPWFGLLFLFGVFIFLSAIACTAVLALFLGLEPDIPIPWLRSREVIMAVCTLFMLFGPALGLFIRQAVSRQREYLADAEAVLLTRDPEGLALALTRIGAWRGPGRLALGPSASHLCIVDPLPANSLWWDRIFPCHPSIQDRVQLLARMGAGIDESALRAAAEEGAKAGRLAIARAREIQAANASSLKPVTHVRGSKEPERSPFVGNPDAKAPKATRAISIPVYEKPDGWSKVLCHLPEDAAVTVCGTEGAFLKVTTANRVVGYISQGARDRVIADSGELTRPD
jgi:heat shock protein HtpX